MPNWKEDMPTRKLGELNRQAEHLLTSTKIMIFEIEISAQADADLRGVYEYIAFELRSPENARGQHIFQKQRKGPCRRRKSPAPRPVKS